MFKVSETLPCGEQGELYKVHWTTPSWALGIRLRFTNTQPRSLPFQFKVLNAYWQPLWRYLGARSAVHTCDRACAEAGLPSLRRRQTWTQTFDRYLYYHAFPFHFLCLKMFGDLKSLVGGEDAPSQGRAVLRTSRLQTRGYFSYTKP